MTDPALTITILYSCKGCGLTKAEVKVPARTSEDVVAWVESLRPKITVDHRRRKPWCRSDECDVMIPVSGSDRVGGAPLQ